ncbi:MAG: 5-(carboxyamino)imidazole ribonucleotide mutase [Deltaproteobacteria bacterium]|jgi:phosphoribosylaminoimidazole carboxylase PurE protein|nr:5-(carboxyamino)imidazole ribonucleotide mutase [Deltaproteobacteria bacterium]
MDVKPVVGIVMGSDSDLPVMKEAAKMLDLFSVPWEITIASAHRSPDRAGLYATSAKARGLKVLIAGAGWAAHLAGVLAAGTTLPVIGVPLAGSPLNGLDALLSTVQMPSGVPVGTMALGGARNAAIFAVQILALSDPQLEESLVAYKEKLALNVEEKSQQIQI